MTGGPWCSLGVVFQHQDDGGAARDAPQLRVVDALHEGLQDEGAEGLVFDRATVVQPFVASVVPLSDDAVSAGVQVVEDLGALRPTITHEGNREPDGIFTTFDRDGGDSAAQPAFAGEGSDDPPEGPCFRAAIRAPERGDHLEHVVHDVPSWLLAGCWTGHYSLKQEFCQGESMKKGLN